MQSWPPWPQGKAEEPTPLGFAEPVALMTDTVTDIQTGSVVLAEDELVAAELAARSIAPVLVYSPSLVAAGVADAAHRC